MTLTQRIVIPGDTGKGLMALAALALVVAIALLVFTGVRPATAQASAPEAVSPIARIDDPACAAALTRARNTRGMPADEAIAASTAMLRACDIR